MAFERVACEVYFVINTYEVYSEHRVTYEFRGMTFESAANAERVLAENGYTREVGCSRWGKPYNYAYITRHLREVTE